MSMYEHVIVVFTNFAYIELTVRWSNFEVLNVDSLPLQGHLFLIDVFSTFLEDNSIFALQRFILVVIIL